MTTALANSRIDGIIASVAVKAPVKVATNAEIALFGEQTVNGVPLVTGDRVLVKDQSNAVENGVYDVQLTQWTRSEDFNSTRDVVQGTRIFLATSQITYRLTAVDPVKIGEDGLVFISEAPPSSSDLVIPYFSYSQSNFWTRAKNGGAWTPVNTACIGTVDFRLGADVLATKSVTATLDTGTGNITLVVTGAGGDTTSTSFTDNGTTAPSVTVTYGVFTATLAWASVTSGNDGTNGTDGVDGAPGAPGAPGADGADGTSVTIKGHVPNAGALPGGAAIGDGYITDDNGHLWVWDGGSWTDVGVIQGPPGADGADGTNGTNGTNGAPGAPGAPGANGTDGLSIYFISIYKRATSAPATPSGGSYNFTTLTLTVPSGGWSDTIPGGTDPIYVSHTLAEISGATGIDSTLTWTAPVLAWQNGEDGADGALAWASADVQMGAMGNVALTKNTTVGGTPTNGHIRIVATAIYFRGGAVLSGLSDTWVQTPYVGSPGRIASVFYLLVSRTQTSSTRFGAGFMGNTFFVAEYDAASNVWNAIGAGNQVVPFTPATDDAIIGIGSRPNTSDVGIRTLASFVVNFLLDATSAPVFIGTAAITNALIQTLIADKIAAGNLTVAMNITTGNIQISSSGKIYSGKASFASTSAGFFLGMDAGVPKLNIGNASKSVQWDGTTLTINGDVVATGNLQSNAVTNVQASSSGTLGPNMATSGWVQIHSLSITTVGFPIDINASAEIENLSTNNTNGVFLRVRRGGTVGAPDAVLTQTQGNLGIVIPQNRSVGVPLSCYESGLAAGTYTYYIDAQNAATGTTLRPVNRYLRLMEIKR